MFLVETHTFTSNAITLIAGNYLSGKIRYTMMPERTRNVTLILRYRKCKAARAATRILKGIAGKVYCFENIIDM